MTSRVRLIAPTAILLAVGEPAVSQSPDGSFANPFRFMQRDGEVIYRSVCQGCHMPDGQGAIGAGAYPALANNPRLAAAGYPVLHIVNGRKAMPPFARLFDDEQVAAVVNYVRTHFGNDYKDAVTAADVRATRR
ncbi:MAG TPA: cytochrome c [Xanthobacteraceae bacterium]|nr:cytochrome c [Xanthobacteraceae bacterium]